MLFSKGKCSRRPVRAQLAALPATVCFLLSSLLCCSSYAQESRASSRRQQASSSNQGFVYSAPSPSKSVEIGNFYLRRKNYHGALSRFEEAIHTDADYAPGYLGLARVCEKLNQKQRALTAYQRYLDLLPSDRDAEEAKSVHQAIARLQRELGQN